MATGWKFDASSVEFSEGNGNGAIVVTQNAFADAPYVDGSGCGNLFGGSLIFTASSGKGHAEFSWNAVADLTTGGEIYGLGHSMIANPGDFKGSIMYKITDANNAVIFNKNYSARDLTTAGGNLGSVDHQAVAVDRVTYDPSLAAYAVLKVEVSISGQLPTSVGFGSGAPPYC